MKRRICAALLALAMTACLLPAAALAAAPTLVRVGDINVTTGYTTPQPLYNGTVQYANGVLTLTNVTASTTLYEGLLAENGDLKIVLNGVNSVTSGDDDMSTGLCVTGSLTIEGPGSLTVTAGNASSSNSYGIFVLNDFTVTGGTVVSNAGTANASGKKSIGIFVEGDMLVTGGSVTARGGDNAIKVTSQLGFGTAPWYKWRKAAGASDPYTRSGDTAFALNAAAPFETYAEIVPDAVYIKTQPEDITVSAGNVGSALTVEAAGNPAGTPNYQWVMCWGTDRHNSTDISHETSARYAPSRNYTAGVYYFYCRATMNGSSAVSRVATVTVVNAPAGAETGAGEASVPKTGDGAAPYLWLSLMLLAGTGFAVLAKKRRA